jgi:HSP20 family protein
MPDKTHLRLSELHGRLGDLIYQFTKVHFSHPPGKWAPPINACRCEKGFAICVDLAGVVKEKIDVHVEPRRLVLQGHREVPEPRGKGEEPMQILAMEIDSGPFSREIELPLEVDPDAVRAEYKDGLLWIYLPFRGNA